MEVQWKIEHFWLEILTIFSLLWKPFVPFLYMLERSCSYYYYPAYYRIKWYWNWMTACINLAMGVIQKCWTAITHIYTSDLFTILYLCVPGLAWAI